MWKQFLLNFLANADLVAPNVDVLIMTRAKYGLQQSACLIVRDYLHGPDRVLLQRFYHREVGLPPGGRKAGLVLGSCLDCGLQLHFVAQVELGGTNHLDEVSVIAVEQILGLDLLKHVFEVRVRLGRVHGLCVFRREDRKIDLQVEVLVEAEILGDGDRGRGGSGRGLAHGVTAALRWLGLRRRRE